MIASILARQGDRFADKTAIRCGPLTVTYGELNARGAATAETSSRVGVSLHTSSPSQRPFTTGPI